MTDGRNRRAVTIRGVFMIKTSPGAGGGGRYTPVSIGPEYIWSGKFTSLSQEKQQEICEVMRVLS